jgi:hypothetical protein
MIMKLKERAGAHGGFRASKKILLERDNLRSRRKRKEVAHDKYSYLMRY